MRTLVVKDGKVLPGMEDLFQKLVEKNKQELMEADEWLRDNIDSYREEVERLPPDWDTEAAQELLDSSIRFGDGNIYYDDDPPPPTECGK